MQRRVIAGLVLVSLAFGIWLLWPRGDTPDSTPTTMAATAHTTTTSTIPEAPPTIVPPGTTTTVGEAHVVQTVEEAETILRDLWFGWFEGIYNQDEERIREVVATEEQLDEGLSLFRSLEFISAPAKANITISNVEILRSDRECLAVWVTADASAFRGEGASGTAVYILRRVDGDWRLASSWKHRDDLWEADCDAQLRPLS